jgi:exopolysaccharide biosynthesis protein
VTARIVALAALAWWLASSRALAAPLPQTLAAPAPFPLVTSTLFESEFVAPGVVRGDYRLLTSSGPLHVSVVAADTHDPNVRLGAVLASDRLISRGETISSMAARTGAVAGINADYFDIGQTNQPLNIVVVGGVLEHPPSSRATVSVLRDGSVRFGTYRLNLDGTTDPPLDDVATALGGGPFLVADGRPATDANAPAAEETNLRFPVAGIATEPDGTILFVAVDGRLPRVSVGLTRPELGALMLGLGARDGMATDSGGSATIVARVLGERDARVLNTPSDGTERPVADGLFIYSSALAGPPARLIYRPSTIRALANTTLTLRGAVTDAAGHPVDQPVPPWTITTPAQPGETLATKAIGPLSAQVPVRVVDRLDALDVVPDRPNPDPGGTIDFTATGFARRVAVLLGNRVRWSASTGTIDSAGHFHAGLHDAVVTANAAGASEQIAVRVGRHAVATRLFDDAAARWRFVTVPGNGPGGLSADPACRCLRLRYDFTGTERAAYAVQDVALPGRAVGFSFDVFGDASGTALRATVIDHDGRTLRLTLARRVDWSGWRRLTARLPEDLIPPLRLVSLYAVGTLGDAPLHATGAVAFRDASLLIAGTP